MARSNIRKKAKVRFSELQGFKKDISKKTRAEIMISREKIGPRETNTKMGARTKATTQTGE